MAKTAAQLMVEFGSKGSDEVVADTKKVGGAVDDAGKRFGFMGTALGTALGFGAIGMISKLSGAVLGIGKGLIGAAADAETMKMSLETAVGSRTEQVFKNLQKFAADTPFEFPELLQSTINLENFGITADKVIGTTGRTWTEIIGDTASAMGKSYDQVTQAVLDASTGEYERLKELGVKASVEGDKVKFSYMKNGKQITAEADRNNSEMIQSTLAAIWNDKYQGAMDKQSRTFNGMWSTMQDNVKMTAQRMSGSIFGFAKQGIKHANLFFDRLNVGLDRGMGTFDAVMRATKFTLQDVFGKTAGNMIFAGIDAMVSSIERGARVAKGFASGIFNVGGALTAAFFGSDRKAFIQNLPSWARSTAQGLSTIAEAGGDLFRAFQSGGIGGFWDALTAGGEGRQIVDAIQGMLDTAIDNAGAIGTKAFTFVVNAVPELAKDIWGGVTNVWDWVQAKIGVRGAGTVGDGTGGPESDTKPIKLGTAFISFTAELAKDIWGGVSDFAGWAAGKIKAGWDGAVKIGTALISATIDGANDLKGWLIRNWGQMRDWLRAGWDSTIEIGRMLLKGIVDGATDLKGWINTNLSVVAEWLKAGWDGVVDIGTAFVKASGVEMQEGDKATFREMAKAALKEAWSPDPIRLDDPIKIQITQISMELTGGLLESMSDWRWWLGGGKTGLGVGGVLGGASMLASPGMMGQKAGEYLGAKFGPALFDAFGAAIKGAAIAMDQHNPFEGLGDTITGWLQSGWNTIVNWIRTNTPEAIRKLVSGDWMGAVKAAFGGGSGDQFVPPDGIFSGSDFKQQIDRFPDFNIPAGGTPGTASNQPGTLGNGTQVTTLPNVGTGSAAGAKVPAPDISGFTSVMQSLPKIAGQAMSDALSASATYSAAIGTVVGANVGSMVGNVAALMGQNTRNIGQAMSDSLSAASTYSNAIYVGVSTNIGLMVGNVAVLVGTLPGIVVGAMNDAAASGAAAAYNAGMSIGAGLANGMASMQSQVEQAAANLAGAAEKAASVRLEKASPSKVFRRIGVAVGDGFVLGMQDRYGDARLAATGLAGSAAAGVSGTGPARLPVRATMGSRGGQTIQVFGVRSREYAELLQKAELGEAVALGLAPELQLLMPGGRA